MSDSSPIVLPRPFFGRPVKETRWPKRSKRKFLVKAGWKPQGEGVHFKLTFDGRLIRTAAVEHEDPSLVIATVRKLGLAGFENVNYVKALKCSRTVRVA